VAVAVVVTSILGVVVLNKDRRDVAVVTGHRLVLKKDRRDASAAVERERRRCSGKRRRLWEKGRGAQGRDGECGRWRVGSALVGSFPEAFPSANSQQRSHGKGV
jgi:hypothetical protein